MNTDPKHAHLILQNFPINTQLYIQIPLRSNYTHKFRTRTIEWDGLRTGFIPITSTFLGLIGPVLNLVCSSWGHSVTSGDMVWVQVAHCADSLEGLVRYCELLAFICSYWMFVQGQCPMGHYCDGGCWTRTISLMLTASLIMWLPHWSCDFNRDSELEISGRKKYHILWLYDYDFLSN